MLLFETSVRVYILLVCFVLPCVIFGTGSVMFICCKCINSCNVADGF